MPKPLTNQESDQATLAYKHRVERAKEKLDRLPYGSQAQMGFDIRVTSTIVSAIFAGRYVGKEMLDYIEGWLETPAKARHEALARSADLLSKIQEALDSLAA